MSKNGTYPSKQVCFTRRTVILTEHEITAEQRTFPKKNTDYQGIFKSVRKKSLGEGFVK